MILRASHNFFMYPFFKLYTLWKIRRNFHGVHIKGGYTEKDLPLLLVSNHISWWDGFWAMYVNLKLFRRKFYFMMLEEQLRKHMFFNKAGGYSVRKGSRSLIDTLIYTASLLEDKSNLVLLFPQGEFSSLYEAEIRFEKGIEYILKKTSAKVQIIFMVNLIEYFSESKPGLFIYISEYQGQDFDAVSLEAEYNRFYKRCIAENMKLAAGR